MKNLPRSNVENNMESAMNARTFNTDYQDSQNFRPTVLRDCQDSKNFRPAVQ